MQLLLLLGTAAAASGASGATAAAAPLLPANLSIDYWAPADRVAAKLAWVDPHAARGVRFSWQLVGGARGVAQAAYQVQVNAGERAVWDSGAVQSNQTLHVEYSGEQPLAADARYRWRVQVTDTRGGKSGFSPWQLLATALDSAEWEASGSSWINGDGRNQLRTEFPVPAEVHAAMAHASLFYSPVGYGLAWLNGVSVAPEAALGPWTTWSQRILYRCSDVTASLRPGANAIGVWLGKGQYDSTWTHAWFNAKEHGSSPPLGLRLVLRVTLKNGTALTVSTSSPQAWQASPSPFVSDDVYKGVEFDARNLTDGFALPHCDGCSGWSPAVAVPNASSFFGSLSPHVYTPTRIIAERHPVKMTRSPTGSYVYWFAENSVGWSTLNNVTLPAGTTLTLAHGEQLGLYEDGKLKQACLVGCENGSVWYAWGGAIDSYTLRGEGKPESYGALFSYHGFQFVELTGWPVGAAPPTLATVSAQVVHADNNRISQLAFPTEGKADLLNKLQENIVRSLLSNMHSVESDCPTRERVGWTGDSQATAETAAMALDMRSFWSKWLQDYEDAQVRFDLHRIEHDRERRVTLIQPLSRSVLASRVAQNKAMMTALYHQPSPLPSISLLLTRPGRRPTAKKRC
jgi:alpha-L-rhamnosidase